MAKRLTHEEFVEQLSKTHPNLEVLSKYNGNKNEIIVKCKIHNFTFKTKPNWLHKGNNCQKCYNERRGNTVRKQWKDVLAELKEKHKDKNYEFPENFDYKNRRQKIKVICHNVDKNGKEHGEFLISIGHCLDGEGCKQCATFQNGIDKRLKIEEVLYRFKQAHGNKYDYSLVKYEGCDKLVKIICPEHGVFEQTPYMHWTGHGCPYCNQSHLEKDVQLFLENNSIKFVREQTFEWLKNKHKLKLDFYLPEYNIAIECQGLQHFKDIEHFGGAISFNSRKELDLIKYVLCKEHKIKLVYIIDNNFNFSDIKRTEPNLFFYKRSNTFKIKNIKKQLIH